MIGNGILAFVVIIIIVIFVYISMKAERDKDGAYICINRQEQTMHQVFVFDNGPDYVSEGVFRIIKDGKIGYADANTGEIVIEPQFCAATPFRNGAAKVAYRCEKVLYGEYNSWISTGQYGLCLTGDDEEK